MATTPTTTAQAPANPFDTLTSVSCALEQHKAALALLSTQLHEILEEERIPDNAKARLYQNWLLLEIMQRDLAATDEAFATAESALHQAGIPAQFEKPRLAA